MNNEVEKSIEYEKRSYGDVRTGELKIKIMKEMTALAHSNYQMVGEKNDYYITLEQLERFLQSA